VMEYCAQGNLYQRMKTQKERGFFEEQQIIDWFVQICLALQYIHERNILHRDIKPQVNTDKTSRNNLSPIQLFYLFIYLFHCYPYIYSDIWSLGWLLHDLCMLDVMRGNTPQISEIYSEELRKLIQEMLSCDPRHRPSADEILAKPFLRDAWGKTTDSLEEVHRKCTAGTLAGSVIGAAGGITAVVGAILAPFTFGASLIVTGVGIGVGVAGGVTGAASSVTNTVKQRALRENIQRIHQNFTDVTPLLESLNALRRVLRVIQKFRDFVSDSSDNVQMSSNVDRTRLVCATELMHLGLLANVGRIAAQTARVGRAAAEAIVAVTGVLSGILVIVDTAFIVMDSVDIHQMRQGPVDDPDKVKSSLLKSIAQMRKTHTDLCNVLKEIKETRVELTEYIEVARAERDLESSSIYI
uniref:non-specific serine/threonine protein kinase n=1 Tax=Sinocyclocheilus grahami TaxID=75366 RepID=A0A672K3E6_SINGR